MTARTAAAIASPVAPAPADAAPPALLANGLTKAFAGNVVLRDVSFAVAPGEIHALVGENGAGKSTLINLITGVLQPEAGTIAFAGETVRALTPRAAEAHGVATVHQELSLCPHLTVAENVFLGKTPTRLGRIDERRMEDGARAVLRELGVAIDPKALAGELPLAEQQLVEIAKALASKPRLLILDEATSALAAEQVAILFAALRRLRERGVAVVFVSHRMEEIFAIADRITVLKNGEYVAAVPAVGTSVGDLVKLMVGREMADVFPPKPPLDDVMAAPVVLSVRDLSSGRRFRDVSFDLHRGEILGLGGLQGQGQRELLAALFGLHPVQGEIRLAAGDGSGNGRAGGAVGSAAISGPRAAMRRRVVYVPEDRKTEGLIVQLPVFENLSLPSLDTLDRLGLLDPAKERRLVAGLVEKLRIRLRSPKQTLVRLSGGNQQKVAIAKWLPLTPEIFLLAEPTCGIDVGTKEEIYKLMRELTAAGASILLISSDTIELLGLCDRVLVMYERRPVATLAGAEVTEENVVHASVAGAAAGATTSGIAAYASERAVPPAVAAGGLPPPAADAGTPLAAPPPMAPSARVGGALRGLPRAWQDVVPIYALTAVFALVYLFLTRGSFSAGTVTNLAAYLFPLFLVAMAQSVVMLTGGIDLAVGQLMSLATVVLATQMFEPLPSRVWAVALVLGGGALLGGFTGAIVTVVRLPAIIVTLATSFIWAGAALFVLAVPGGHLPVGFAKAFTGTLGPAPVTLLVLALALLLWKWVATTPLGLAIYAVGDNPRGAFVSGLPVRGARLAAWVIAGMMTALAGIGLGAYAATGDPLIGAPYSLASISAAVLGGVSFFGGQGRLRGAVAGALALGLITQILFISGLSPAFQRVIYGGVLVVALGVKAFAAHRIEEAR